MDQQASSAQNRTSVERQGDRELVVTRTFDAAPTSKDSAKLVEREARMRAAAPRRDVRGSQRVNCAQRRRPSTSATVAQSATTPSVARSIVFSPA